MKKIIVIGAPGSGKSTFSLKLGNKLGIPVYHLDKIWWKGDWENVTTEEFDKRIAEIVSKKMWIIDGNYRRTLDIRLKECDTVVYLDYNGIYCMVNALIRCFRNRGKVREDMGGNCIEKFDLDFIKYIVTFNRRERSDIYRSLENYKGELHIFRRRRKLNKWLDIL